jgi:hypothetical protein
VATSLGSFAFLWCMFVLGVMYVIKVMGNELRVGSCGPCRVCQTRTALKLRLPAYRTRGSVP